MKRRRPVDDHRRNGVLEDQLFLMIVLQDQRKLVKTANPAGQLDAAQQVQRDGNFIPARVIQESFLDILNSFFHLFFFLIAHSVHEGYLSDLIEVVTQGDLGMQPNPI